jgi:hypothetical protein
MTHPPYLRDNASCTPDDVKWLPKHRNRQANHGNCGILQFLKGRHHDAEWFNKQNPKPTGKPFI